MQEVIPSAENNSPSTDEVLVSDTIELAVDDGTEDATILYEEILAGDLERFEQTHPKTTVTFWPEETVAFIRQLPKSERGEMVDIVRTSLAQQQEALTECRLTLERAVRFDPNISAERLLI
jgi:hypothetical protein